jgi:hypothetical protein
MVELVENDLGGKLGGILPYPRSLSTIAPLTMIVTPGLAVGGCEIPVAPGSRVPNLVSNLSIR